MLSSHSIRFQLFFTRSPQLPIISHLARDFLKSNCDTLYTLAFPLEKLKFSTPIIENCKPKYKSTFQINLCVISSRVFTISQKLLMGNDFSRQCLMQICDINTGLLLFQNFKFVTSPLPGVLSAAEPKSWRGICYITFI